MKIFKILNILAASKEDQISYLTNLGTYPCLDELALEFNDEYQILVSILNENENSFVNSRLLLDKFNEIDGIFEQMSNMNEIEFWNADALDTDQWNKVRELANEVLDNSGISYFENL